MATQKLEIKKTIMDAIQYGLKNVGPLILMVILYVVTIWIPYLNVGTTIGFYKSIIKIGKGEVINPLAIFDKENFKVNLGEFFLLIGLLSVGISAATIFMFIPGIVMGLAWGFAVYFFLNKGLSPVKAMKVSYKVTDGEKWTIFWITFILTLCFSILSAIFAMIPKVGMIFVVLLYLVFMAVYVAVDGVMYAHFAAKADEIFADKIGCCHGAPKAPEAPAPAPAPAPEAPKAPETPAPEAPEAPAPEAPEAPAPEPPAAE